MSWYSGRSEAPEERRRFYRCTCERGSRNGDAPRRNPSGARPRSLRLAGGSHYRSIGSLPSHFPLSPLNPASRRDEPPPDFNEEMWFLIEPCKHLTTTAADASVRAPASPAHSARASRHRLPFHSSPFLYKYIFKNLQVLPPTQAFIGA